MSTNVIVSNSEMTRVALLAIAVATSGCIPGAPALGTLPASLFPVEAPFEESEAAWPVDAASAAAQAVEVEEVGAACVDEPTEVAEPLDESPTDSSDSSVKTRLPPVSRKEERRWHDL